MRGNTTVNSAKVENFGRVKKNQMGVNSHQTHSVSDFGFSTINLHQHSTSITAVHYKSLLSHPAKVLGYRYGNYPLSHCNQIQYVLEIDELYLN